MLTRQELEGKTVGDIVQIWRHASASVFDAELESTSVEKINGDLLVVRVRPLEPPPDPLGAPDYYPIEPDYSFSSGMNWHRIMPRGDYPTGRMVFVPLRQLVR